MVENLNFGQISKFWSKNRNFRQKLKFSSKIENLFRNRNLGQKFQKSKNKLKMSVCACVWKWWNRLSLFNLLDFSILFFWKYCPIRNQNGNWRRWRRLARWRRRRFYQPANCSSLKLGCPAEQKKWATLFGFMNFNDF